MTRNRPNHSARIPQPPKAAERLLAFVLHHEEKEAVLGDLAEEYVLVADQFSGKQARQWYWLEVLKSIVPFTFLTCKRSIRSHTMSRNNQFVLIGAALVLPAFLLVLGGVAQSGLGTTQINDALNFDLVFFHPVVILGGLGVAFLLNLLPVIRIDYRDGVLISQLTIRDRLLNLALISGIGLLSAAIFLYLLAENTPLFQPPL